MKALIKEACSPKHVPEKILETKGIPYTISGKKVEIAVKNIIDGNEVLNIDALEDPSILDNFINLEELNC